MKQRQRFPKLPPASNCNTLPYNIHVRRFGEVNPSCFTNKSCSSPRNIVGSRCLSCGPFLSESIGFGDTPPAKPHFFVHPYTPVLQQPMSPTTTLVMLRLPQFLLTSEVPNGAAEADATCAVQCSSRSSEIEPHSQYPPCNSLLGTFGF